VLELDKPAGLVGLIPPAFELLKFIAEEVAGPMTEGKCEAAAAILISAKRALN
jgi:hypothetical protein